MREDFKEPQLWQFSGTMFSFDTRGMSRATRKTFGVVAVSMERACDAIRGKHPDFRIERIEHLQYPVHLVVDDPEAIRVANRLEGKP